MDSVFLPSSKDDQYVTFWVSLLDNYMHEYHVLGDEWMDFRKAAERYAADKQERLVRQFVQKNVADTFISRFGSGSVSAEEIIPKESIDAFSSVLMDRLSSRTLRYV